MVQQEVEIAATSPQFFGRMFPDMQPFVNTADTITLQRTIDAIRDIGEFTHAMDAKDVLEKGPAALIVDPALNLVNQNNPNQPAGITFLGQFLDHDLTFDTTSQLAVVTDPNTTPNTRNPALDLDSVYGGGPTVNPELYNPADRAKLRIESGGRFEDLPRRADGTAIISDPRNDENLVIAGLQAAFILFHNRVVDRVRSQNPGADATAVFTLARQQVMWHYQWIVLTEFLPLIIGQDRVNAIRNGGRRFFTPAPGQHYMPVEFQGAAYRFGHSQVRPSYRVNLAGNPDGSAFFAMIFDPAGEGQADPVDMRGGRRAPRRFIGWQTFFDFGPQFTDPGATTPAVKPNKRIDTRISSALFRLPLSTISSGDQPIALPVRNMLRGITWNLPSGQNVARAIGAPVLGAANFPEWSRYNVGLEANTPLWFYVLKEAEVMEQGLRLGPVGATIVGEVFIGLMQVAPGGFLLENPGFQPNLPARTPGTFRMIDLLTFAQVDPTSRGQ
ncbi:peroxidase family protein [Paractinoplanes rishiriensis]|uniref:Myeloperoxidase n=1 Tax=Paractinoplanes rishiriensis TaxID=1050105 RepID=A0A919JTS8_9ACTN|nr:heme peroxidase family protein [Actinoplanes rishiriensis]GIE94665.1 myeloperoxidase [Actinoplanes rishiriensis]